MIDPKRRRGINIANEIASLKKNNLEYNKAIDDVIDLLSQINKSCKVVHSRTGLYFNGYDESFTKGKNTLSQNNFESYMQYGKTDDEILRNVFKGNITKKDDGKEYVWNKIIYEGSFINKRLSDIYADTNYIPLEDFKVDRE